MSYSQIPQSSNASKKVDNKPPREFVITWVLSLVFGVFGADRFYLGKTSSAVAKLLTFGGFGVWYLIDLYTLLKGGVTDASGQPLIKEPENKKKEWRASAVFIAFVLILMIINSTNNADDSEPVATPSVDSSQSPTPTMTSTPIETVSASPSTNPDSPENVSAFVVSANRDLADMNKDLDDMVMRANNAQMIRLIGNTAELGFNIAQLQSLIPPTAVSAAWIQGLADADVTLESLISTTSDYSSSLIDLGTMVAAIENMRAQVANLSTIVSQAG